MLIKYFLTFIIIASAPGCISNRYALLERAEELSRQEKFDEAISLYRQHIAIRLEVKNKPEWENPYFYLLAIGDIQLHAGRFDEALKSFELAEQNKVEPLLISDRYRYVASLYERDGKFEEAIAILTTYRDRDPFLYDLARDRAAKALVQREEAAEKHPHAESVNSK